MNRQINTTKTLYITVEDKEVENDPEVKVKKRKRLGRFQRKINWY